MHSKSTAFGPSGRSGHCVKRAQPGRSHWLHSKIKASHTRLNISKAKSQTPAEQTSTCVHKTRRAAANPRGAQKYTKAPFLGIQRPATGFTTESMCTVNCLGGGVVGGGLHGMHWHMHRHRHLYTTSTSKYFAREHPEQQLKGVSRAPTVLRSDQTFGLVGYLTGDRVLAVRRWAHLPQLATLQQQLRASARMIRQTWLMSVHVGAQIWPEVSRARALPAHAYARGGAASEHVAVDIRRTSLGWLTVAMNLQTWDRIPERRVRTLLRAAARSMPIIHGGVGKRRAVRGNPGNGTPGLNSHKYSSLTPRCTP